MYKVLRYALQPPLINDNWLYCSVATFVSLGIHSQLPSNNGGRRLLLLDFTGLGTFLDRENTDKMASFSLYFTELASPIRGVGGGQRRGLFLRARILPQEALRGWQLGATCPNDIHPQQNRTCSVIAQQHPLSRACKPASLTSADKGNQTLALRGENFWDSVLCRIPIPPPGAAFSFHQCPHPDLPLRSPTRPLLSSLPRAEPASSSSALKEDFS